MCVRSPEVAQDPTPLHRRSVEASPHVTYNTADILRTHEPRSVFYDKAVTHVGSDWLGLVEGKLPVDEASSWVVSPSCGAVAVFSGTARDHSEGRDGVTSLEYEAYERPAEVALGQLATEMRQRWSDIGKLVMLHRVGLVPLSEAAVVVAVSAPHRDTAFEACRYGIDTIKETVPIWKKETWSDGQGWGHDAREIRVIATDSTAKGTTTRG